MLCGVINLLDVSKRNHSYETKENRIEKMRRNKHTNDKKEAW